MRNMFPQIPLAGIYDDVCSAMENNKSDFIQILEENIDFHLIKFFCEDGNDSCSVVLIHLYYTIYNRSSPFLMAYNINLSMFKAHFLC